MSTEHLQLALCGKQLSRITTSSCVSKKCRMTDHFGDDAIKTATRGWIDPGDCTATRLQDLQGGVDITVSDGGCEGDDLSGLSPVDGGQRFNLWMQDR